ncbi:MAG TPA: GIY-YIG nuclease family protein [Patescibacteria group bacterium]|nr:GIY-YIG nuclease family protein [Patescibacteria group bacterium]
MAEKGVYCLCIKVQREMEVGVGALGNIRFTPGHYIYVGSALNGIRSRIERHLRMSKRVYNAIHWHIDYLLKEEGVSVASVYFMLTDERMECSLAEEVSGMGEPVKGFGCSDCGCVSHLFNVKNCNHLPELGLSLWRTE